MKKMLLCSIAALGLLGFTACGGSDKKDDVEDAGITVTDAGTSDAGHTGDAGTIDAGHDDDAGTIDAGHNDDAGIDAGTGPEGFEACTAEDNYGDVDFADGQKLDADDGTYYDWGDGMWEVETFFIASEDAEIWVDVNNGEDNIAIGPGSVGANGTFELGSIYPDEGLMYCLSSIEADAPAACAAVLISDENSTTVYEMFSGTFKLSALSETKLAGSIENGYFYPWESMFEDGEGGYTWCYVPPVSFSFEATLKPQAE